MDLRRAALSLEIPPISFLDPLLGFDNIDCVEDRGGGGGGGGGRPEGGGGGAHGGGGGGPVGRITDILLATNFLLRHFSSDNF